MKFATLFLFFTIIIFFVLTVDEYQYERKIKTAFENGVTAGRKYCGLDGVDSVMMDGNIYYRKPINKVQSITFKYDSILILNFDSSEVK